MSTIIRPCGLVLRESTLLTMRYRYGPHDRLNLPGGNLEPEEQLHTCLIREFQEELNLTITPHELLYIAETKTHRSTLHLVFRVETTGTPHINPQHSKACELVWLTPAELTRAPLYPAIGPALLAWLNDTPFPVHLGAVNQPWFPQ
ncbi:MAG: NUDIX hydrolase [Magnetococcales bacterium]|nr:NUDIX hydrolase [Magnetococcales bacterium]